MPGSGRVPVVVGLSLRLVNTNAVRSTIGTVPSVLLWQDEPGVQFSPVVSQAEWRVRHSYNLLALETVHSLNVAPHQGIGNRPQ